MTEEIKILAHTPGSVLLLNTMAAIEQEDFVKRFNIDPKGDLSVVKVQVLINGVEVSFTNEIEVAVKRILDRMEKEIEEKAFEMLKEAKLWDLKYQFESAEWAIRNELQKVIKRLEGG